jgi:hypothetical protein
VPASSTSVVKDPIPPSTSGEETAVPSSATEHNAEVA